MEDNDFTENEHQYIQNFLALKESIPQKEVSIFRVPISTRKDLLNTILWLRNEDSSLYDLASNLVYTDPTKIQHGKQRSPFFNSSYPFWNLNTEKEFSDILTGFINTYLPILNINLSLPTTPTTSINESFLRHYETSIELLLKGPPHADEHDIDEELASAWVNAQKTPERKRLAKRLLDETIYISHSQLLQEIQETIERLRSKLIPGLPTIFITGTKSKSNYYISLLFYHFWRKAGLTVDIFKVYMDEIIPGNILDIDEMAYSGTQTTGTLSKVYKMLVGDLINTLEDLNCKQTLVKPYCESRNFIPLAIFEKILANSKINYIIVRIFCSENGEKELMRIPHNQYRNPLKFPSHIVIGKKVPSPESLFGKKDAAKLSLLFGAHIGSPASTVYFNHKIANIPSTYLFPFAYGVVPNAILTDMDNYWMNSAEERALVDEIRPNIETETNTNAVDFLPFIRYCQPGFRLMPRHRKNLLNYVPPGGRPKGFSMSQPELPQEFRCPYAWYKRIDYEAGTYNPLPLPNIPLPHGPTEENFMGGRRTRRQRKQKQTRKARKQK
jgi:hypothetical protein